MSGARIALIHATPVAMEPIREAFASGWPEAEPVNILDDSLAAGSRIGMVATFAPAVDPMQAEFEEASIDLVPRPQLTTLLAAGALDALRRGDTETHDRLVAQSASRLRQCDVVMLAQFSTARARKAVQCVIGKPVLTSPDAAVAKLRALVKPG